MFLRETSMTSETSLSTSESRLDIKEEGDWTKRVFFNAFLKDKEKNWLQKTFKDLEVF